MEKTGKTDEAAEKTVVRDVMEPLEKMADFFTARVDIYDDHMMNEVEGCREAYLRMAGLVPEEAETLLDLGCGTGLELEAIWKRNPELAVTGIDLTPAMLGRLKEKHPEKKMRLIEADYLVCDLGEDLYDGAVSFETLHHFTKEQKAGLYERLWRALKDGGCYVECDYMAETQEQEDYFFAEKRRLEEEQMLERGEYYHFDTPCTMENQKRLLKEAGFMEVEVVWRMDATTIMTARKKKRKEDTSL